MKIDNFVHLHVHTKYSFMNGMIKLGELFNKIKEYKMTAVAMTDYDNMSGAVNFYKQAISQGVKPIIGCEVGVVPRSRFNKRPSKRDVSFPLVLLVKNEKGYKNLCKLISAGYLEGYYYRPIIDKELLSQHSEGLIALSAGSHGEISTLVAKKNMKNALKSALEYLKLFGKGSYFLEISDHGFKEQKALNKDLVELSRKTGIPLVATNDVHYLEPEHSEAHEVLLCIKIGKTLKDKKRIKFPSNQFYFKSPEEMKALFQEIPEAIKNTMRIADKCNYEMPVNKEFHLPRYTVPETFTASTFLSDISRQGLEKRLKQMRQSETGLTPVKAQKYRDRLESELRMIKSVGYSKFFLIVGDIIDLAHEHQIPVGPGLGSMPGSLLSYALRITNVDPLQYNLYFERFLNSEKVSIPKISIDICMDKYRHLIKHVIDKYGYDNVCDIITFSQMDANTAIRDVGRVINMPCKKVDKIAKLVSKQFYIDLSDVNENSELLNLYDKDAQVRRLLEFFQILKGLPRYYSTHKSGLIISPKPVVKYVPIYKGGYEESISQFEMEDVEYLGLFTIEFRNLRALTFIDRVAKLIRKNKNTGNFDINKIPLSDPKTYNLLCNANTKGIFLMEDKEMRGFLKKIRPDCFEDIIALPALYRPGPINCGMVDDFIRGKHGKKKQTFVVPQLKNILKDTYGVVLYQEQVMCIAQTLAGFSLGMADLLRRVMGKKKPEEVEEMRNKFVEGAKKNHIKEDKASRIFDLIEYFSGYGFNKSHSAAYALITYQTAYLKANYPKEFFNVIRDMKPDRTVDGVFANLPIHKV